MTFGVGEFVYLKVSQGTPTEGGTPTAYDSDTIRLRQLLDAAFQSSCRTWHQHRVRLAGMNDGCDVNPVFPIQRDPNIGQRFGGAIMDEYLPFVSAAVLRLFRV